MSEKLSRTQERRIEPWREPPPSLLPVSKISHREIKGTTVVFDGVTLRVKGIYSDDLARALIASHRHQNIEGIYQ